MLTKQAKPLTDHQFKAALAYVTEHTQHPLRNRVMLLLSHRQGLRACEIGRASWSMVTDAQNVVQPVLRLENLASKGTKGGRELPLHKETFEALQALHAYMNPQPHDPLIVSRQSGRLHEAAMINWFWTLYKKLGFNGCSSHSGRRRFGTQVARKISQVGGSIRDVQILLGHTTLQETQKYIDGDSESRRKVVGLV